MTHRLSSKSPKDSTSQDYQFGQSSDLPKPQTLKAQQSQLQQHNARSDPRHVAVNQQLSKGLPSGNQPVNKTTSPIGQCDNTSSQNRILRVKRQSIPACGLDSTVAVSSPQTNIETSEGAIGQTVTNKLSHQQARTMRISQQRILRETSLESVLQSALMPQPVFQSNQNNHQARNFAADGLSFSSLNQMASSSGPPQKLVKKVAVKGSNGPGTVRQSSMTHRQGPILQSGPHTRSKSSAVGLDTSIQMHGQSRGNSRKSNSRGRATPQARFSVLAQPQQHLRKVNKLSVEQQQKSLHTITSPKDSSGDLNTSLPLPLSKSQTWMMQLEKNQGTGSEHQNQIAQALLQPALQKQTTATPSAPTFQHTRKQSTARNRSNSKKRGSVNASVRRQSSRSPGANQRANSLLNNSIGGGQAPTSQPTQISKQSAKASKLMTQTNSTRAVSQLKKEQLHMAALTSSAFYQQIPRGAPGLSDEQINFKQSQKQYAADNPCLVLAMSAAMNNPPQGHRLTPLVQSSKAGAKSSNERKNRSVLHEAAGTEQSAGGGQREPAKKLIGVELIGELRSDRMQFDMLMGALEKQQQILSAANNNIGQQNMSAINENATHKNAQIVAHQLAPSSFSSFSKEPAASQTEVMRHSSAQKILRPKQSLPLNQVSAELLSYSPNGLRQSANPQQNKTTVTSGSAYSRQQAQVVQMMLKQQRNGAASGADPDSAQHRLSQNVPYQKSMMSSAQSSRTAHDLYLKQALQSNTLLSSHSTHMKLSTRTVNSVQSGVTPYEQDQIQRRAQTSQEVVQELYGSHNANRQLSKNIVQGGVTFHDFRPKTSLGQALQADGKLQMVFDKDVQGLSPEPRAEIILSKSQIQRAAKARQANQAISVGKNDMQKLKFSQIQQANASLGAHKEATRKVLKSQRVIQQSKHHAKSFSNSQATGQNNFFFEGAKNFAGLNPSLMEESSQQQSASSATHQETSMKELSVQRAFEAKSASKVHSQLVQNWIYAAENVEEMHDSERRVLKSHQTFGQLGARSKQNEPTPSQDSQSLHARSLFSSDHSGMPIGIRPATIPVFNVSSDDNQTQSQRLLVQNGHHLSQHQPIQQHLKSVQVDSRGMSSGSVLRSGRSNTKQRILQAEVSHQKILGPLSQQLSQTSQPQIVAPPDHNAYANNAEDYFKKTPAGTKTPAEKPSKKLSKATASGKQTTTVKGSIKSGGSGVHKTQADASLLLDSINSQQKLVETQSALTVAAPLSFTSSDSVQNVTANTTQIQETSKHASNVGMSRSRLSQFVIQSNTMKSLQSSTELQSQQQQALSSNTASQQKKKEVVDTHPGSMGVSKKNQDVRTAASNQSELLRKKNQTKIAGSLSAKQQSFKVSQHAAGIRGTGPVVQKDPDTTVISSATLHKVAGAKGSSNIHPNAIHAHMLTASARAQPRPKTQTSTHPIVSTDTVFQGEKLALGKPQESQGSRQDVSAQMMIHQMSERRQSQTDFGLAWIEVPATETRNQTALEGGLEAHRFNLNQPAHSVSEFEAPTRKSLPQSKSRSAQDDFWAEAGRYAINEEMPQRLNKANCWERVDKKLSKNELLLNSQLSTTTSHSSSSYKGGDKTVARLGRPEQPQFLSHLVTFEAHQNSVLGLQTTSGLTGPSQFATFSSDNSIKVWSVATEKPTEFISNNRAAAMNLPSKVVLKRQVKNQARPSQKLCSFAFMQGEFQPRGLLDCKDAKRTILVTGSTDRVLRVYAMDHPESADDYQRLETFKRKDRLKTSSDVMQPALKLTGQHRGVISSIVQLPETSNDFFLTGCSDGLIRMYSLSALDEEQDAPLCTYEQAKTGVQQICAMSENTFLTSGYDNTVRLWDVRVQEHQRLLEDPNFGRVTCLQKYNSSIFASACNDGLVNFWDTRKMQLVKQVTMASNGSISAIQFAKKRQFMLAAHDHKLSIINIAADVSQVTKSQQWSFTEPRGSSQSGYKDRAVHTDDSWGKNTKITSMIYNEAEKKVITGGFNKKVTVWNVHLENFN